MSESKLSKIRNFSIIAHIDHGKSTISDRIIQLCGGLTDREMSDQVLDSMDIEKERGITIKSQAVSLKYEARDGEEYSINLMDTPGHVDFSYEVSRCLSACEGSLLVVDAAQGVEAQTLANVYKAIEQNHEIIPVLNKIDLPSANPESAQSEIENLIGIDASEAILCSGKTGIGIADLLEAAVEKVPPPSGDPLYPLQALLVDAWYDTYLGVIVLVRVFQGTLKKGQKIKMLSNSAEYDVDHVGIFTPKKRYVDLLSAGEVGFIVPNIKDVASCRVGDTFTHVNNKDCTPLPGFKPIQQVVFCGLYPLGSDEFGNLNVSIQKLALNDSSFTYEKESSSALGLGFRCGFLGLLHLEIVKERLFREFDVDLITTAPSVVYKITHNDGTVREISNSFDMPDPVHISQVEEPWITATIFTTEDYLGSIFSLCTSKRGEQEKIQYSDKRIVVIYKMPLNEVVFDFYDKLKSVSSGYASLEWEIAEYRKSDIVKMRILINAEEIPELSFLIHKTTAERRGRSMCEKLKELIPRQMFEVRIQSAINGKVVASERISAFRKDVTAKCYGGDASRKKKLLEKQKKGKKRMRGVGNIEIPQSAFVDALKVD